MVKGYIGKATSEEANKEPKVRMCPKTQNAASSGKMHDEDMENAALEWFPEKVEFIHKVIDDSPSFAYPFFESIGYGQDFSNTLIQLLKENRNKAMIRKYCRFLEMVWRNGDHYIVNAMIVTVIEKLACESDKTWELFGHYLSEEFRNYINNDSIPGNMMLSRSRIPLLTAGGTAHSEIDSDEENLNLTAQSPEDNQDSIHSANMFYIGSYHMIKGRIKRFLNRPERLEQAVAQLSCTEGTQTEFYRFSFPDAEKCRDRFSIVINRFSSSQYIRNHLIDAFLQSVLSVYQMMNVGKQNDLHIQTEADIIKKTHLARLITETLQRYYGDPDDTGFIPGAIDVDRDAGVFGLHDATHFERTNRQEYKKLMAALSRLPENTEQISFIFEMERHIEIYAGAEGDMFFTIIYEECFTES